MKDNIKVTGEECLVDVILWGFFVFFFFTKNLEE